MRLLQSHDGTDGFSLVEFLDRDIPPYAILSHTWGTSHEEVTYQDMLSGAGVAKIGYNKLTFCAAQAATDGLRHFWVDTCCINKESSAELSEAITSMFRWYHNSSRCYVYLTDVQSRHTQGGYDRLSQVWRMAFRGSRWFTRGWTLQELVASRTVIFFSKEGDLLGDKVSLEQDIHEITNIPTTAIRGAALDTFDVEERISWIARRQTSREEDMAYSLLGILKLSMLANYGEGKESAFKRLRREVQQTSAGIKVSLLVRQREALLMSLRYDHMHTRQMTIGKTHIDTCEWFLSSPEYLQWIHNDQVEDHHGFLWIKGKPGTGKSTLMKFALSRAFEEKKKQVLISFFFNARGEKLEKGTVGAYRSLLFQLIDRCPEIQSAFDCLNLPPSEMPFNFEWATESLEKVLEEAISLLGESPVFCYIDALDECNDEQVRDMIRFFEQIGTRTSSAGVKFSICFSSRHYPHIAIRHGLSLVLEGQKGHSQDIVDYLKKELAIGKSEIAEQTRKEVLRKASGVFMWVVLVVKILNKEYDRGRLHKLQERLHSIPDDLYALFRNILTRDSHDNDALVLCIQWVLFAQRPLGLGDLYIAILSTVQPNTLQARGAKTFDESVMERFILDCSRGLTEITPAEVRTKRKVQFIHESVRDFLLEGDHLHEIWPEVQSDFVGQSHDQLKQCCLDHITGDAIRSRFTNELARLQDRLNSNFLEYTLQGVLYHAEAAQSHGIAQNHFLKTWPRKQWVKLLNAQSGQFRYTTNVSTLYLLAERNMINLMKITSLDALCLTVEHETFGCALFAAAASYSGRAFEAMLNYFRYRKPRHGANTSQKMLQNANETIPKGVDRKFRYSSRRGMLSHAAEMGLDPVVEYLLAHTTITSIEIDKRDDKQRTPLWWASGAGHATTVELLLRHNEVNVNIKDQEDEAPIHIAAANGEKSVVKLLLKGGAIIEGQDSGGYSPLNKAIYGSHWDVAKLLIAKGANVNIQGGYYGTALQAAALYGEPGLVELLIDRGADVNVQGGIYDTAIQAASCKYRGNKPGPSGEPPCDSTDPSLYIVQLLIDRHASVNLCGGYYGTALKAAAHTGSSDVVELLLSHGADLHAQVGLYGTALNAAHISGHLGVEEILIAYGASTNVSCASPEADFHTDSYECQDDIEPCANINEYYDTVPPNAAYTGYESAPMPSNEGGTNIGVDCTELQVAALKGDEKNMRRLLRKGADVNALCGTFGTALQAAASQGRRNIVALLIEKGADVNLQCGRYGNALNAALQNVRDRKRRHGTVVSLLLKHGAIQQGLGPISEECDVESDASDRTIRG